MSKKNFAEQLNPAINPAMQFVTPQQPAEDQHTGPISRADVTPPPGFKLNPMFIENRSRRIVLMVQPSMHQKIKARADAVGISMNQFLNDLISDALKE